MLKTVASPVKDNLICNMLKARYAFENLAESWFMEKGARLGRARSSPPIWATRAGVCFVGYVSFAGRNLDFVVILVCNLLTFRKMSRFRV